MNASEQLTKRLVFELLEIFENVKTLIEIIIIFFLLSTILFQKQKRD